MEYKIVCEVSFPLMGISFDVNIPVNKTVEYVCKMLDKIIVENISANYQSRENSILINKRTGTIYDKNVLIKTTDIGNGTKLTYY